MTNFWPKRRISTRHYGKKSGKNESGWNKNNHANPDFEEFGTQKLRRDRLRRGSVQICPAGNHSAGPAQTGFSRLLRSSQGLRSTPPAVEGICFAAQAGRHARGSLVSG